MPAGSEVKVREVGRCIYCGRTDVPLSREHVIPHGLDADWVLRKASCPDCSKVTSQFEEDVLKDTLRGFRAAMGLPSYRKGERPQTLPITVGRGGQEFEVELPLAEGVAVFQMPHFPPAGFVEGRECTEGISVVGSDFRFCGKPLEEVARELGANSLSVKVTAWANSFARLLAKVAYGAVVLYYGPDHLDDVFVLPAILGKSNDIGYWVGAGRPEIPPEFRSKAHYVQVAQSARGIVLAHVGLLARFGGLEYSVVVGHTPHRLEAGA